MILRIGAWLDVNLSIRSLKSKIIAIEIINAIEKKYVPKNFLMI